MIMMRIPIFVALLFLGVIAGALPVNGGECKYGKREFEVAEKENASFEVRLPRYFNGDPNLELYSWRIDEPYDQTKCKIYPDYDRMERSGSIESCFINYSLEFINCFTVRVLFRKFDYSSAGIWNIAQLYWPTANGTTSEKEEYSIILYETEFDHRFDRTIYGVKAGDNIVMNLIEKNYENSECRLINRKTNEIYDLNAKEHRFSGKRMGIQKLDRCGFRMQIENKSEGLWSLIGENGWMRQRADFQLSINPPVQQKVKLNSTSGVKFVWVEDFKFSFELRNWRGYDDESIDMTHWQYWELERPDGTIVRSSNNSQNYINFDRITKDDGGIWKIRRASDDTMVLIEENFSVTVIDLPEVYYSWPRNSTDFSILFPSLSQIMPERCFLKNRNGRDLSYSLSGEYSEGRYWFKYSLYATEISDDESTNEWEISMHYSHTKIIGLIVGKEFAEKKILPYVWRSVQRIKYVVRGEEIKMKCSASTPITNCTLTNPNNVTKYFLNDNSLITRTNCSIGKGFCGCSLTIMNANDTHAGNWSWEMEFEGSRKVNSLAPISVVDSYLITEIEQLNFGNEENKFEFNCRPLLTLRYRKIRYCKWFDFKNRQILTGNQTIVENRYCSLKLEVLYREDLNVWKCVAGLDGISEEEIHATFDLSKISFNVTEEEPKKKLGKREELPFEILSPKLQDNATRKLPELLDVTPGILTRKISDDKLEKSSETFDIGTLVMVIAILISIVSSCLAIFYCIYNKMQMRKKIRKAQGIRKLLVEIKHGPSDPETMMNEQVDYIQYNEGRWEYPFGKLRGLNELGRGNFGVVSKARAWDIVEEGKETQVAVK